MANDDDRERRHRAPTARPAHEDASEGPSLLDQVRNDPAMYRRYLRSKAWRREQAQAADGPTSQPLNAEQEAQRQAEYTLLQQEKAQQHQASEAAQERLNAALEAQYGHKPEFRDLLKGSYWRQQLRAIFEHPARELTRPMRQTDQALKQMLTAALQQNARHTRQIMEDAQERGLPMTPIGASVSAGVSDTLEEINTDVAACKEELVRALEAESNTDKAMAAFNVFGHMSKAGLGAYSLAAPLAGATEAGAAGGGMSPAVATAGIDGASGAMSGGAVAEATAAPVGSGLAGAAVGEVLDDGQSFAKDRGERQRPQREYEKHQWSKPNVRRAAKSIEEGESIVRVETRAQAEELRRKLYPDCKDTTGLTGKQVREMRGNKNGTYHWDDQIGEDGLVQGHGPENPHAADPHLQIHTEDRRLIRIMFSQ